LGFRPVGIVPPGSLLFLPLNELVTVGAYVVSGHFVHEGSSATLEAKRTMSAYIRSRESARQLLEPESSFYEVF
jgi:hypothetical protein